MDIDETPLKYGVQDDWHWDVQANTTQLYHSCNKRHITFRPPAGATVAVQGTKAVNNRRCYWEIELYNECPGSTIKCGLARKGEVVGHLLSFVAGAENGWGLTRHHLNMQNGLAHGQSDYQEFPVLGVYYDRISGTLSFFANGKSLGLLLNGLDKIKEPLYPCVICDSRRITVMLRKARCEFSSLRRLCLAKASQLLSTVDAIEELELPESLKTDLKQYKWNEEVPLEDAVVFEWFYASMGGTSKF